MRHGIFSVIKRGKNFVLHGVGKCADLFFLVDRKIPKTLENLIEGAFASNIFFTNRKERVFCTRISDLTERLFFCGKDFLLQHGNISIEPFYTTLMKNENYSCLKRVRAEGRVRRQRPSISFLSFYSYSFAENILPYAPP